MLARGAAVLLLSLALAGCLAPAAPAEGTADLVLLGGKVWVGDEAGTVAQALAVRGGRVLAVGSDAAVAALQGPGTRVVDLRGGLVLPGLRDQHTHVLEVAAASGTVFGSFADDPNPYDPSFGPPDPVGTQLFRAQIGSYHAATKAAGRTPSDDWQDAPLTDCRAPSPVTPQLKERLRFASEQAAQQGLTAVVEAGLVDLGVLEALRELREEGQLRTRFLVRIAWGCIDEAHAAGYAQGWGDAWVRVIGVKLYADGWLGPRTSALREPYSDRPLSQGILFLEPGRVEGDVRKAKELGYNLGTHTIGDRAIEVVLDAYQAAGVRPGDRWALEHVQVLAPELLDRMAALGVVGVMQTSFATSDMGFAQDALGPDRVAWAYAWGSALERGVRLAGSTDFPIEVLHPLWGAQRTVTRQEFDGTPPGGWFPEQRLSVERTLRLLSADAAYASLEDDRGTLAPGQWADLVVLREDILQGPPEGIAAATVQLTMANGVVTFEGAQAYPPRARAASTAAAEALAASAPTKGSTPSASERVSGT